MMQMEEGHTSHYAQAPRETRRAKKHVCQNCPDDVYIFVAMSDNLSDQITHAKFFSSYHYEQQKLKEKVTTQSC